MKLLLLLTLPLVVYSVSISDRMRYEADCLEEMSVPLSVYIKFVSNPVITESNEGVKDFPICFYRKMGYMKDGRVQMDVLKAEMNKHGSHRVTNDLFEPCENIPQKEDNERENAFQVFLCFVESLKSFYKKILH